MRLTKPKLLCIDEITYIINLIQNLKRFVNNNKNEKPHCQNTNKNINR